MEALHSERYSSFITLTYSDENLPQDGLLETNGHRKFLERYRYKTGRWPRHYAVGEYGELYGRPHYHLALFGEDPSLMADTYQNCWDSGHVHTGVLQQESAAYIAGYVTKKIIGTEAYKSEYVSEQVRKFRRTYPKGIDPNAKISPETVQSIKNGLLRVPETMVKILAKPEYHTASRALGMRGCDRIIRSLSKYVGSPGATTKSIDRLPSHFRCLGKNWPMSYHWRIKIANALDLDYKLHMDDISTYNDDELIRYGEKKEQEWQQAKLTNAKLQYKYSQKTKRASVIDTA